MKKKHKITLLVIGFLLALSLMLSSSYALWVFNVSQESTNVVQADCFEITLTDNNPIGLSASFPMRDSDGVKTTPYTFIIRNICNHPADFQINLETLNTSTIDESFIKVDLNGHITEYNAAESVEPTIDGAISAAMLYEDTLAANGEKTYNLRVWVNEIATQEDVENKSYASKVSVKATVKKQYDEGTLISGKNFNAALKRLADGGNPSYSSNNTSITSIEWSNTAPQESDNTINLAANGTATPIYAWFKDGTIYINSELDKIYMNTYSQLMFYNMKGVTSLDLSHFDTSKVKNMERMFQYLSSLTNIDLSHFDTSNVTTMSYMFCRMNNLKSLDVSHFNTSNVTDMSNMFNGMSNLTSLDVNNFDTSNVTSMSNMFNGMSNLTSLDVSNFDTSNVTSMSDMFHDLSNLTSLDVSGFDTSNVTDMSFMFNNMSNLTSLDVSNFDTSKVTSMGYMFNKMSNLTSLDVSNFDTSKVTNMSYMFNGMSNLSSLDVSHFDTSKVKNMERMFDGMTSLTSIDVSHFDTSKVTNMFDMFFETNKIGLLDLTNFDTSNVTNMGGMFGYSFGYSSTYCPYEKRKILGLELFNTSNVTDMKSMFANTCNLETINVSNFDTSKVTNMSGMFAGSGVKELDLSNFNTSNVTNMSSMFYGIYNITELDISSFDTSKVTNMSSMFGMENQNFNLNTIYVGNKWNTSKVASSTRVFNNNISLVGGSGTIYDSNHTDVEYARVDDPANGKPGYFTLKTS